MAEPAFFAVQPRSLGEIAEHTGAKLANFASASIKVAAAGPIEAAPSKGLSFVDNPRYLRFLADTEAVAVFCSEKYAWRVPANVDVLVHEQPYKAYAKALSLLYLNTDRPLPATGETSVSTRAIIADDASIEAGAIVEPGAIVGPGAEIGSGTRVLANAVIGPQVRIGRNCAIGIGASVQHALIGDNVIIHPGVRIGQDGFGFAMGPGGHIKVPQIGRVIIQDHVEIGANSTVDRGANRDTVIGEGTKIDNLVQIGHNVVIGRHCVIVGMAGIAGSATLGDYVVVAGQAGIVGHVTIGDGAQIGGGSGINTDVAPGARMMGYPAMPIRDWARTNMRLKRLAKPDDGDSRGGDDD